MNRLLDPLTLARQLGDPAPTRRPGPDEGTIEAGELEQQTGVLQARGTRVARTSGAGDEVGDDARELVVIDGQVAER